MKVRIIWESGDFLLGNHDDITNSWLSVPRSQARIATAQSRNIDPNTELQRLTGLFPKYLHPIIPELRSSSWWRTSSVLENLDKLNLATQIRAIQDKCIRESCLYYDAWIDIELPLLAWFQDIVMFDTVFMKEHVIGLMIDKIKKYGSVKWLTKDMHNPDISSFSLSMSDATNPIGIHIVPFSHWDRRVLDGFRFWFLLGFLKYPEPEKEIYQIDSIQWCIEDTFLYYDDRSCLGEPTLFWFQNIPGSIIWKCIDKELSRTYVSPYKPQRFPDASKYMKWV